MSTRFIEVRAGRYRLALPLIAIRQILDLGGGSGADDPKRLGLVATSLADALEETQKASNPALLLFEGQMGPQVISVCGLGKIFHVEQILPIPRTVRTRWPELLRGVIRHQAEDDGHRFWVAIDPAVMISIVESYFYDRAK